MPKPHNSDSGSKPLERLLKTTQATLDAMRALNRIGQDLTSLTDLEELLQRAGSYLNDLFDPGGANIVLECSESSRRELQSQIAIPVRFDEEVLARIVIPRSDNRPLGDTENEILEHFSRFLAIAISRVKRLEATYALASIDPVTGIMNRRRLIDIGERELNRARSTGVIVFDIDHFKTINDAYGHQAGDAVLKSVAQCAQACIRKTDFIARYGGDEFAILMPDTPVQTAMEIAERVRLNVQSSAAQANDPAMHATVSIGLACAAEECDLSSLISRADQALYAAKRAGRNVVCCFRPGASQFISGETEFEKCRVNRK